ncbi:hypothetical protein EIP91_002289 [Steccherinum ochraceum]|uniref:DUF6533 domain-containing protein n=1 Tax=Steccherinum ochraceum TaxID=92696 RepID=A0A4R0RG58_9APHY|nr:hypothetical protein EIP91_002289 [Steccherinum ochraceum]
MSNATDPLAIASEAATLRVLNYTGVSPAALLVYDYLLTVDSEVAYIWPTQMSVMKVLFFYTRYSCFVDLFLGVSFHLTDGITPQECHRLFLLIGWLNVVGIIVAEVVMVVRTWAIWNKSRRVGIGLAVMSVSTVVAGCLIEGLFLKTLTFTSYPHMNIPGCALTGGNPTVGIVFILIIIVETIALVLTLIKGVQRFRHLGIQRSQGLVYVLYRDGVLFYLYLFDINASSIPRSVLVSSSTSGKQPDMEKILLCSQAFLCEHPCLSKDKQFSPKAASRVTILS